MQTPELTNNAEFPPPASTRPFVQGAPDGPALSAAVQRDLLKYMMMTREVDDRIEKKLYRQGKIVGGVYTGRGQEAISVAFTLALEERDYIIPSHRDRVCTSRAGCRSTRSSPSTSAGKDGPARGKDGNMHMGDLRLGLVSFVSCSPTAFHRRRARASRSATEGAAHRDHVQRRGLDLARRLARGHQFRRRAEGQLRVRHQQQLVRLLDVRRRRSTRPRTSPTARSAMASRATSSTATTPRRSTARRSRSASARAPAGDRRSSSARRSG